MVNLNKAFPTWEEYAYAQYKAEQEQELRRNDIIDTIQESIEIGFLPPLPDWLIDERGEAIVSALDRGEYPDPSLLEYQHEGFIPPQPLVLQ